MAINDEAARTDDPTQPGTTGTGAAEEQPVVIPEAGTQQARQSIQETGQQAAKGLLDQTPVTAPGYTVPTELPQPKAGATYVSPEATVQHQLSQILSKESPLSRQAEARSRAEANRLGLMSSSMAVGAGQKALYDAALPIAEQDAQTYAKSLLQQQASENVITQTQAEGIVSGSLKEQEFNIQQNTARIQAALDAQNIALDADTKAVLTDLQGKWDFILNDSKSKLDASLQKALDAAQIDAASVASAKESSASLIQNYLISVEEVLKDPDFLQLGAEAISDSLNNMLSQTTAGIQFLSDSAGINLDEYLDDFEEAAAFTAEV